MADPSGSTTNAGRVLFEESLSIDDEAGAAILIRGTRVLVLFVIVATLVSTVLVTGTFVSTVGGIDVVLAIVDGIRAERPLLFVGLLAFYDDEGDYMHRCSGTLLSPTVVLTEAHCTEGTATAYAYCQVEVPDDFRENPTGLLGTTYTHPDYDSLVAIAAVCQQDTSAIVALGDSDIDRPADLDGNTYASYDARFEDHIVEQLVRNDGGEGDIEITTPPKLGIWNTLVEGAADATWVFMPWEGVLAERDGIERFVDRVLAVRREMSSWPLLDGPSLTDYALAPVRQRTLGRYRNATLGDVLDEVDGTYFDTRQAFEKAVRGVIGTGPVPTS
jgi:hypothetical protein